MEIKYLKTGNSFINISIANVFIIIKKNSIDNTVTIANSFASSLASVQNDSAIGIAVEPITKLAVYSS
jgi:hypothetical protein